MGDGTLRKFSFGNRIHIYNRNIHSSPGYLYTATWHSTTDHGNGFFHYNFTRHNAKTGRCTRITMRGLDPTEVDDFYKHAYCSTRPMEKGDEDEESSNDLLD